MNSLFVEDSVWVVTVLTLCTHSVQQQLAVGDECAVIVALGRDIAANSGNN
jgi:hypothetical protein